MKTNYFVSAFALLFVLCWAIPNLEAQRPDRRRDGRPPANQDQAEPQKEADDEKEKPTEKDQTDEAKEKKPVRLAIVNGDIHTVTGEVIRRGTILVEDGKIKKVGRNIDVPKDAEVIDATGQIVAPGFVAINMGGIGLRGTLTGNAKLEDALDPYDRNIKYALSAGITTGCLEIQGARGGGRRGRRADNDPMFDYLAQFSDAKENKELSNDEDASKPREVTLEELMGVDLREGEPEHRFLGIDPEIGDYVTESQLDYGMENTQLCPCCGLPILPTEPIEAAPPTREQPRRHAAVKMSFGNLEDMLLKEDVFYSPAPGGLTGALNKHNWRRDIRKAREAMEKEAEAQNRSANAAASQGARGGSRPGGGESQQRQAPTAQQASRGAARPANNPLVPLLKKEVALRITANTAGEIRDMVALAQELDYDLIIEGATEAWLAASELSNSGTQVIYTPRRRRDARLGEESSSGSSAEATGIFETQGIPFAIAALSNSVSMGGIAGRDLMSLPLEAAFAVRAGASNRTALESITIVPARMMGLEDRIGSIEVGKDADLIILNGDPMDYRTYVETAIVAGKVCYDRTKDRVIPVYPRD